MIFHETPKHTGLDLSQSIQGHTADEVLTYKTAAGQPLLLACFYPPDYQPERRYPAIAMIHGGGWSSRKIFDDQSGWSGDHLGFLARLFALRGFLTLSVDYRLLPDAGIADMIEDCRDAVTYIRQRFAPETLDLLGESASGYLAAVDSFSEKPQFQRVILANPITDLTLDCWRRVCTGERKNCAFPGTAHRRAVQSDAADPRGGRYDRFAGAFTPLS